MDADSCYISCIPLTPHKAFITSKRSKSFIPNTEFPIINFCRISATLLLPPVNIIKCWGCNKFWRFSIEKHYCFTFHRFHGIYQLIMAHITLSTTLYINTIWYKLIYPSTSSLAAFLNSNLTTSRHYEKPY